MINRLSYRWTLLLALALGPATFADQIINAIPERGLYAIGTEKKTFKSDDLVCLFVDDVKVACGDIFKVAPKGILLYVSDGARNLKPGTIVDIQHQMANPQSRAISVGGNFVFPTLHFQQHFTGRLAYALLGEAVIYSKSPGKVKGIIALMTLSYHGQHFFKGPWLMAGAGIHFFNLSPISAAGEGGRNGITSFVGQLNLGWRFRVQRVTIGAAIGAQYWLDPALRHLTLKEIPGVLPSVMLDVGLVF